ncbi:MAG: hypothetical protein ACE366_27490 [Bradymonadia bacterium]
MSAMEVAVKRVSKSSGLWSTSVGAMCLALSLGACTAPEMNTPEVDASAGPPARVDLPAPIKLEGTIPPETHPDGRMRVDGLMVRRDQYFGQKVMVRGYVVETYVCPKDAKKCQQPHVYLADTPAGGDKRLLVAHVSEDRVGKLEVGKDYVFTGTFDKRSQDGFAASMGLLMHEGIEGFETVEEEQARLDGERKKKRRRRR